LNSQFRNCKTLLFITFYWFGHQFRELIKNQIKYYKIFQWTSFFVFHDFSRLILRFHISKIWKIKIISKILQRLTQNFFIVFVSAYRFYLFSISDDVSSSDFFSHFLRNLTYMTFQNYFTSESLVHFFDHVTSSIFNSFSIFASICKWVIFISTS